MAPVLHKLYNELQADQICSRLFCTRNNHTNIQKEGGKRQNRKLQANQLIKRGLQHTLQNNFEQTKGGGGVNHKQFTGIRDTRQRHCRHNRDSQGHGGNNEHRVAF